MQDCQTSRVELKPLSQQAHDAGVPVAKTLRANLMRGALSAYTLAGNIGSGLVLSGPLDLEALHRSYLAVLQRHESLRTLVKPSEADGQMPVLVVQPVSEQLQHFRVAAADSEADAQVIGRAAWTARYDLSQGPRMRLQVISLGAERHWLVLAVHHGIADQMSALIILRDLAASYSGILTQQEPKLPHLPFCDLDYTAWVWEQEKAGVFKPHQAFWQKQLSARDSGETLFVLAEHCWLQP